MVDVEKRDYSTKSSRPVFDLRSLTRHCEYSQAWWSGGLAVERHADGDERRRDLLAGENERIDS